LIYEELKNGVLEPVWYSLFSSQKVKHTI